MPFQAARQGFNELSPYRIAYELFVDKKPGDRIAITTRVIDGDSKRNANIKEVVRHLRHRGLKVRVIGNQSGVEDFCFLKKANELVGTGTSTFVRWAAYLSSATKVKLYYLNETVTESNDSGDVHERWKQSILEVEPRIQYKFFVKDIN
jgi:ribosomal protein L19